MKVLIPHYLQKILPFNIRSRNNKEKKYPNDHSNKTFFGNRYPVKKRSKLLLFVLVLSFISIATLILHLLFDIKTSFIDQFKNNKDGLVNFSDIDFASPIDSPFYRGCINTHDYITDPGYQKANASFVMLTRNEELDGVLITMQSLERHFNQWFQYPYVFLNDKPFTEEFKSTIRKYTTAECHFGVVESIDWEFPEIITSKNGAETRNPLFDMAIHDQGDRGIMYGNMESYHKMCRFYSGMFYRHPLVTKYEWYWRIEPDVQFYCDISYDPFVEMHKHGKKYGFTVLIKELYWTVPNLFRFTKSYIKKERIKVGTLWELFTKNYKIIEPISEQHLLMDKFINKDDEVNDEFSRYVEMEYLLNNIDKKLNNAIDNEFLSDLMNDGDSHMDPSKIIKDKNGISSIIKSSMRKPPIVEDKFDNEEYNLCHFWSNFEIARVDTFNNDLYNKYFQFLEESGGFWTERWGDAPVHSLGISLFLNKEDVHYFRDIGYQHSTLGHCPANAKGQQLPYVANPKYEQEIFPKYYDSSLWNFLKTKKKKETEYSSGCRCKCPLNMGEIEDTSIDCVGNFAEIIQEDFATQTVYDAGKFEKQVSEGYINYLKDHNN
ncbi:related to Probable mannosyltransferase KTR5 [Saccharomycodes ludwigii]|uniref:Related to Probable mannosyltransferase KTR5 n=1 Tax=Saccharomycodes ludwigii TaxID=36035 RepID=A0A376B4Y0_9ASCO|nr:hypothetical protein SCDLUD_002739 [Saccharomycodes ludwigii]KAH3901250.1 hypothetical protein SCDLUD_002739 [Saccharomycodes ludwigii]SSD59534.1 related to Probable mannosyltransferase KTR5 [Saccharomycodes ludwigii]